GQPQDVGRLRFVDSLRDRMMEEGVEQPHVEAWERIDRGESTGQAALVMKLNDGGRKRGWFVAVGNHFILALDRRRRSPDASHLEIEISHGLRNGPDGAWVISGSTLPWREKSAVYGVGGLRVGWQRRTVAG